MRVAFVGSQQFSNMPLVVKAVALLDFDDLFVSGGGPGVDTVAENAAKARQIARLIIPAQWTRHSKRAGILRNPKIVASCHCLLAFWDGTSPGTKNSISHAIRQDKPLFIIRTCYELSPNLMGYSMAADDPHIIGYIRMFLDEQRPHHTK